MSVKENAKALVESLADNATWEDLIYQIYVQEAIDQGLEASAAGRVHDSASVLQKLGLSQPLRIH
jgi:predicted transcriptional regulator